MAAKISVVSDDHASPLETLSDAIRMWRVDAHLAMAVLVDSATQCLVEGYDSESLRLLAGASPSDSQFLIEPLVVGVAEELGLTDALSGEAAPAALVVLARRFLAGEIDARQIGRWAHEHIDHEGDSRSQPFVNLDDHYDDVDAEHLDDTDLVAAALAEARALVDGKPSPRLL